MKDVVASVIVDLTPTEEQISAGFDKQGRWGIHRAIREGLTIEKSNDWDSIYDLYRQTMIDGGASCSSIKQLKDKTIVLFICKKNDKIIAGASLENGENGITLQTNFSMREFNIMQPNNLLYWECIKWAKAQGHKTLDLGGYQINPCDHLIGVNKFKERFGKVIYYEKDYPFLRAIGRKIIRNSGFFWWLNKKIRGRK